MSDPSPSSLTLRQQVAALPDYVLAAWRTRYIVGEGMDFQARAILNQEAAAIRNQGKEPDGRTVWLRLMDRTGEEGGGQELLAATALAGLATGLRPSGFEQTPERPQEGGVTSG